MAVPQTSNASDINTVIASLASRQSNRPKAKPLAGAQRAAVLMLALGEQYGGKVWALLDDDEVRELSIHMSNARHRRGRYGRGSAARIRLADVGLRRADGQRSTPPNGCCTQYLPGERVVGIMDEIRGPAGRNMWEKLSNVQEEVLANYLKNEYPQTIAVVLSKLKPEHAARVLAILPEDMALDVVSACCGWKRCRRK